MSNLQNQGAPSEAPPSCPVTTKPLAQEEQPEQEPASTPMKQLGVASSGKRLSWAYDSLFGHLQDAELFHVMREAEMAEAFMDQPSEYTVKDQAGNTVFYVDEETKFCARICFQSERAFTLTAKDLSGRPVMIMERATLDMSCCCCFVWADMLTVKAPDGKLLGSVMEKLDIFRPKLRILNASGRTVLKIKGPACRVPFDFSCRSLKFKITNLAGQQVGCISRHWPGLSRELFTDADYFSMSLPLDLDPMVKAICLAALFLVNFEYFESNDCPRRPCL